MFKKLSLILSVLSLMPLAACQPANPPATSLPVVSVIPANTFAPSTPTVVPDPQPTPMALVACTAPVDVPAQYGKVIYNGISFGVDPALAHTVAAQVCPALPHAENQMPGEAHPPYTTFIFPTLGRQNIDIPAELRVYEVTGDMSSYTYPLNMLDDLQTVLVQHPEPVTWFNPVPLHTRQKYLDFARGAGARGLVQYMQDYFFFTNNGLLYEFNGLTGDGRHYVSLQYPLAAPFLMELDGPDPRTNSNAQAIAISDWPDDYEQRGRIIQAYNAEALSRLEEMAESDVTPNLALLDALAQSLQVAKR